MAKNKNQSAEETAEGNPIQQTDGVPNSEPQADDLLLGKPQFLTQEEIDNIIFNALKDGKLQPNQKEVFTKLLSREPELAIKIIETQPKHAPHPDYHSNTPTQNGVAVPRQTGYSRTRVAVQQPTQATTKPSEYDTTTVSNEKKEQIIKEIN